MRAQSSAVTGVASLLGPVKAVQFPRGSGCLGGSTGLSARHIVGGIGGNYGVAGAGAAGAGAGAGAAEPSTGGAAGGVISPAGTTGAPSAIL